MMSFTIQRNKEQEQKAFDLHDFYTIHTSYQNLPTIFQRKDYIYIQMESKNQKNQIVLTCYANTQVQTGISN